LVKDGAVNMTNTSIANNTQMTFPAYGLTNGLHNWSVNCTDSATTANNATWFVTYTNDTPIVTIYSPTNTTYTTSSILVNFTVGTNGMNDKCWYDIANSSCMFNNTCSGGVPLYAGAVPQVGHNSSLAFDNDYNTYYIPTLGTGGGLFTIVVPTGINNYNNYWIEVKEGSGITQNISISPECTTPSGTVILDIFSNIDPAWEDFNRNGTANWTQINGTVYTCYNHTDSMWGTFKRINGGTNTTYNAIYELDKLYAIPKQITCNSSETVTLPIGSYEIDAYGNTTSGVIGSSSQWFTVDTTISVTQTSPTNTSYNTSTISYNVTTNSSASACIRELDGATNNSMSNSSTTNWYLSSATTDGSHYSKAYCNSSVAGVWYNSSTVYFYVDTNITGITIASPTNSTYNVTSINYNITTNKSVSACNRSIDGGANSSMSNSSTTNWYLGPTNASIATHYVTFYCNYSVTGGVASATQWFEINGSVPGFTTITSPIDGYTYTTH
jgi:hypothetical protein